MKKWILNITFALLMCASAIGLTACGGEETYYNINMAQLIEGMDNVQYSCSHDGSARVIKGQDAAILLTLKGGYKIGTLKLLANGTAVEMTSEGTGFYGEKNYEFTILNVQMDQTITFSGDLEREKFNLSAKWTEIEDFENMETSRKERILSCFEKLRFSYSIKNVNSGMFTLEQFKTAVKAGALNKEIYFDDVLTLKAWTVPSYAVILEEYFFRPDNGNNDYAYEVEESINPQTYMQTFKLTFKKNCELNFQEEDMYVEDIFVSNNVQATESVTLYNQNNEELKSAISIKNAESIYAEIAITSELSKQFYIDPSIEWYINNTKINPENIQDFERGEKLIIKITNVLKPFEYEFAIDLNSYKFNAREIDKVLCAEVKKENGVVDLARIDNLLVETEGLNSFLQHNGDYVISGHWYDDQGNHTDIVYYYLKEKGLDLDYGVFDTETNFCLSDKVNILINEGLANETLIETTDDTFEYAQNGFSIDTQNETISVSQTFGELVSIKFIKK